MVNILDEGILIYNNRKRVDFFCLQGAGSTFNSHECFLK